MAVGAPVIAPVEVAVQGSYDPGRRRRGVRRGREAGCWVYIPAAELRRSGHKKGDPPPWYRIWGRDRGSVLIRLYKEG